METIKKLIDPLPDGAWVSIRLSFNEAVVQVDLEHFAQLTSGMTPGVKPQRTDGAGWLKYSVVIDGVELLAVGECDD
jgi:hypothetical protein